MVVRSSEARPAGGEPRVRRFWRARYGTKLTFADEDEAVVPPIRKFAKYIGQDQKEVFKMWKTGPMKPITKYGGLPKPTGCV